MNRFVSKAIGSDRSCAIVIATAAFAVMLPVLINGIPTGHDLQHHYQCAMTFVESFREGILYPDWSVNRNHGFGGMETRLYPPVSHFVLAVAHLMTGEWHLSSWIVFVLMAFAGSFGVYLWARESMNPEQAVVAGLLYTILPYHVNQLYNTFFFAEFAGSSVLPYSFLFISRVCRKPGSMNIVGLTVSLAMLVLTHLPMTLIASVCFVIYSLSLLERGKLIRQIGALGVSAALAVGAGAFFWMKVLAERDLMAKATVYSDPWLDFRVNFLLTIIQTYEGFAEDVYNNGTRFYDMMLWYTVVMVVLASIPRAVTRSWPQHAERGIWAIAALSVFLTLPFSAPLWENLPLLSEVQFPWRWLAIVSVTAPVLTAFAVPVLIEAFAGKLRPFALIAGGGILALSVFTVSQLIRPAGFVERHEIASYMERTSGDEGLNFWWPKWARKEIFDDRSRVGSDERAVEISEWAATSKRFSIGDGPAASARIGVFYHPNWTVSVSGTPVITSPDRFGALAFEVPSGPASIEVKFEDPRKGFGYYISAAAWFLIALIAALRPFEKFSLRN